MASVKKQVKTEKNEPVLQRGDLLLMNGMDDNPEWAAQHVILNEVEDPSGLRDSRFFEVFVVSDNFNVLPDFWKTTYNWHLMKYEIVRCK